MNQTAIDRYLNDVDFGNVLTEEDKAFLDKMPSLSEVDEIVKLPKENKSPGLDGIPIEFYRKFWGKLRSLYYAMINETWRDRILPYTTRTSVLSTLFKDDNRKILKNYRPLSLTNCDYRIIAMLFSNRLDKVLPKIINFDQSAYLKERFIGTSVRNIIDLYEYCEKTDKPGALLLADFKKAFDSLEHNFIVSVLKRFNFGINFISWLSILYNGVQFKVKNNGWISQSYSMERGLRQGCSLSALVFIIIVEVLAIKIRSDKNILGIEIGANEHKLIQYADDTTVCVRNLDSINYVVKAFEMFGICSGLQLNLSKTKGIWLGNLKQHGYRVYNNIIFTGNPIKCLGIYIGHKKEKCYKLNWERKLLAVQKCLEQWNKRRLTLFGKVHVIKTYAISKIVYQASVLVVPENVKEKLKSIVFEYLWGKRDKVKRSNVIKDIDKGGLGMLDINCYLESLKSIWITRLLSPNGKWSDVFQYYVCKIGLPADYLLKCNVRSVNEFPLLEVLPPFYQAIFLAFNKSKYIKPFKLMNKHEVVQEPIWGNVYFKVNKTCLYLKDWIKAGIMYIKDLIDDKGSIKGDEILYNSIESKNDIVKELYIIKNYVIKKIRHIDVTIAPYVKIANLQKIVYNNKYVHLEHCKSRDFYRILSSKCHTTGHMESIYNREFNINNCKLWENIYKQKITCIKIPKLAEFNYKMLQNIVPCGKIVSKWQKGVNEKCDFCGQIENVKHMLFECPRVSEIWKLVSTSLGFEVKWKHIVCGFPSSNITENICSLNYVIGIIVYSIFNVNSKSKFEKKCYKNLNMKHIVKEKVIYYNVMLNHVDKKLLYTNVCIKVSKCLQ